MIENGTCKVKGSKYDKKKTGDREKKNEKEKDVSFLELFRYTDALDKMLLVIGTFFAIVTGATIPLNLLVYGKVANEFILHDIAKDIDNLTSPNVTTLLDKDDLIKSLNLFETVGELGLYFCLLGIGAFVAAFISTTCFHWTMERQVRVIRERFFSSVMQQDIAWFDTNESGELSARFLQDIHLIGEGIGDKVSTMIQWIATCLIAFIIALSSGWKLALAAMSFCPAIIVVGALQTKWMSNMSTQESQSYASAGSVAEEAISAIQTVAAFNGQDKECERYNHNLKKASSSTTKKSLALGLGMSAVWLLFYGSFSVAFWYGVKLMQDGEPDFEPGSALLVFTCVMVGSMSLGQAFPTLEVIASARGAARQVYAIIKQRSIINFKSEEGERPESLRGTVKFTNIFFNYPARPNAPVLQGLSLDVSYGSTVALVGPSGCGKSTVIQLLQRFYDPQAGEIFLDDINIKDLNVCWLRQQIGVVSQEPVLFGTTVAENIKFGRMDVTQAEIEKAAIEANAHVFIKSLPQGYETPVGDRGTQLSGGQKQRIAIARALVRNPKILLLDEATSALDNENEALIQKTLEKAAVGRTIIVVAHRLSTIRNADMIYCIDKGRVQERGTHNELMGKEGLYYKLVHSQDCSLSYSPDINKEERFLESNQNYKEQIATMYKLYQDASISNQDERVRVDKDLKAPLEGEEKVELASVQKILTMNSPEWVYITMGCISCVVVGAAQPSFAIIVGQFLDVFTLTAEEQVRMSMVLVIITMSLAVSTAILRFFMSFCFVKAGSNLTTRLRKLAFRSIIWQDMAYFDDEKNTVGSLTTRLANDAALVQGASGSKIGTVLESISVIISALVIALYFSWKLTLVVLAFMPLTVASGTIHGKIVAGFNKGSEKHTEEAGKICTEAIDNVRTVVCLTREQTFIDRYNLEVERIFRSAVKKSVVQGLAVAFGQAVMFFAYAASFTFGARLTVDREIEFENVFRVFGAVVFGGTHVGKTSSYSPDFIKGRVAATRLFELIERKPKIDAQESKGKIMECFKGSVKLQGVRFTYPSRPDVEVLNGLDVEVQPGETIAFVGSSGCGKSTTVQLIERFYDPASGKVTADGEDIRNLNLQWLRSQIGVVSQEPVLFDTNIADNIAYGDNSRTVQMDEIIKAAREANIHSFISDLPNGYGTKVGNKGTQLSGGQKQRVAIARALIRNPKILLLDEATSALDCESERVVQEALDKAREGRTCVVIAQRLSTIQSSDKIAVIHKGQVVEIGSHSELMAKGGIYYRLSQHNTKDE